MMSSNSVAAQIVVSDEQAKPEHINGKLYEYPPSVKLVFKTLEGKETMTLRDIEKETYLPYRTVRYAVKRLKEAGLVIRIFYVKDARRALYRLAE
jgi:DNA-binding MarR family transcriptional regulator